MKNANNTLPWRGMVWAGLVTTAVLGGIYLKAAAHIRELTSTLAQLEAESASSEPQVTALQNEIDATTEDIAAIVGGPTSTADEVRRNANLVVIARLKSVHEGHTSAPLTPSLRMLTGISIPGGFVFPELINDPEYRAAYLAHMRAMLRQTNLSRLRRLGISEEISEKVITVLAEHEAAAYDYRQITGNKGFGAVPAAIARSITEDTNNQLKQIMGDETYQRYEAMNDSPMVKVPLPNGNGGYGHSVPSHEALVATSLGSFIPLLATRLSYSDSPLQPAQANQLAEQLATLGSGPSAQLFKAMYTDAFIEQASKVLTSPQLDALRQLQAENQAIAKRGKLPKSSELPRNAPVLK